jgi:tetratricopeptide (TPR) repeat protein
VTIKSIPSLVRTGGILWVLASVPAMAPPAAEAQEGTLSRVEGLVTQGRTAEARSELEEWWDDERAEASRLDLQRGIWLRALLTVDPELAEMDYQRLALEFRGGPYSAGALVRLGYAAQARGDILGAAAQFEAARRDYPGSDAAQEADRWFLRWESQLETARGRARAEEAARAAAEPRDEYLRSEDGRYAVQMGAFRSVERAEVVADRARAAGLLPRIVGVEGSGLIRIRVGRFDTSEEATDASREIAALGLEVAVVTDAHREIAPG